MMTSSSSNTILLFFSSSSSSSSPSPPPPFKLKPSSSSSSFPTNQTPHLKLRYHNNNNNNRQSFCCKAVFSDDAPFAAAIAACMLTSLVFPIPSPNHHDDDDITDSTTDTRLAVMGILSFVPYFNWLSWVFAWLDTGNRRYALYSLVYLLPYLRTNLSLSPEESWLPIASILFCIVHIQQSGLAKSLRPTVLKSYIVLVSIKRFTWQLEASIRNGDIQGFQLFRSQQSSRKKANLNQRQEMFDEGSKKDNKNLPSAQELSRDIGDWEDSQRPLRQRLDDDDEDRNKH
ncbi:hypothetical protein RIF29_37556 [Crotalaria pallida]|uniref:Uncharacterized protein n=1 Tax=Crotalaria pallida TaxID=3830 RepID=A0AAN9HV80_CROPI